MTEILAPCGGTEELKAAIAGGADAVYFGGKKFNARQSADNFSDENIADAIKYCHLHKVKAYVTLNTVVSDKEIQELIPFIRLLNDNGCDGVIIQSLGLMSVIKEIAPCLPVHASTQLTVHSLEGVKVMAALGFERVVVSRELSYDDLKYICDNSPIEIEAFIHGALCMCYSGQCYFSSVIGTRSGNRGSCAQPCRKLYKNGYELSLKDISMAQDFKKFLSLGVASLKIEGRLKSGDYVYGVTKTYRRLTDENRNANPEEVVFLKSLFSRQGFTNGYFKGEPSKEMFGIRTDADKSLTEKINVEIPEKKVSAKLYFSFKENQPLRISYMANDVTVEKIGDIPQLAQKRALNADDIKEKLVKTGDTPFTIDEISYECDDNLFIPVSLLNSLRRDAMNELYQKLTIPVKRPFNSLITLPENENFDFRGYNITLHDESFVNALTEYEEKIRTLWIPFNKITKNHFGKTGVLLPAIIKDSEAPYIKESLKKLKTMGINKTYCRTWDAVQLSINEGFVPTGGFSLNLFNSFDLIQAEKSGIADAVISPECSMPVIRNIKKALPTSLIVYGRLSVMVTENCIIKNAGKCINHNGFYGLTDKTNTTFPVMCEYPHRNIILNSAPVNLSDKTDEIYSLGISFADFIFTDETESEIKKILSDFETSAKPQGTFTRGLYYRKI